MCEGELCRAGRERNGKDQLNARVKNCGISEFGCLLVTAWLKQSLKDSGCQIEDAKIILRQSTPSRAESRTRFASKTAPSKMGFSAHTGTMAKSVNNMQIF